MLVKNIINMLSFGTRYEVRGSFSGKKLFDSNSSKKTKDRYLDLEVPDSALFATIRTNGDFSDDYCRAIIGIWACDYELNKEVEEC